MRSINNISFQFNDAVAAGWRRCNAKRIINLPAYIYGQEEEGEKGKRGEKREVM